MTVVKFYGGLYHGQTAEYPTLRRAERAIEAAGRWESIGIIIVEGRP
jgi:hypothetical protein